LNNGIKTGFKIYVSDEKRKWKSSFFDLIPGNNETKQTKGLACLMSLDVEIIFKILELKPIKNLVVIKKSNVSQIEVIAEMISDNKKRVDITIVFTLKNGKKVALLIEAKSISIKSNKTALESQIKNYLNQDFALLRSVEQKFGIALTKY
jgi:hypothetical protein